MGDINTSTFDFTRRPQERFAKQVKALHFHHPREICSGVHQNSGKIFSQTESRDREQTGLNISTGSSGQVGEMGLRPV